MSRTYRKPTYWKYPHRHPKTFNEIKANSVDYDDTGYTVSSRHRYVPTAWDDRVISAYYEQHHHH
jgi:hypothetical protein